METHVRNPQRRQIVSLKLPSHPLSAGASASLPEMRRHIPASTRTQSARGIDFILILGQGIDDRPALLNRRHRVLERTPRSEMLSAADPTLDLLILQGILPRLILLGHARPALRLFRLDGLPVHARPELQVLGDAGGVGLRAFGLALLETEFRPGPPLGDVGVDALAVDGRAGSAGGFDTAAVVVEAVDDRGFGAVFVGGRDRRWQGGRVRDVRLRDIVSPVGAARMGEVSLLVE